MHIKIDETVYNKVEVSLTEKEDFSTEKLLENLNDFKSECSYERQFDMISIKMDKGGLPKFAYICVYLACVGGSGESLYPEKRRFFTNNAESLRIIKVGERRYHSTQLDCNRTAVLYVPNYEENGCITYTCEDETDPEPLKCRYNGDNHTAEVFATYAGLIDIAIACIQLSELETRAPHIHFDKYTYLGNNSTEICILKE